MGQRNIQHDGGGIIRYIEIQDIMEEDICCNIFLECSLLEAQLRGKTTSKEDSLVTYPLRGRGLADLCHI